MQIVIKLLSDFAVGVAKGTLVTVFAKRLDKYLFQNKKS